VVAQAADFRKKYNSEGLIPFPFEETIEKIPDLTLSYLNTTNEDISGAIYLEDGIYKIVINSAKPPKRQYFTLAHEIAHYCIHKKYLAENDRPGFIDFGSLDSASSLLRPDSMPVSKQEIQIEREANTFAAELIMPEREVRDYFDLNGDIEDTAAAFRVSVAAMAVRLEKIGLV